MSTVRLRRRRLSVASALVAVAAIAALASPWSNSIPPAHLAQEFGYQTPVCWIAVVALAGAVLLETPLAVWAVGAAACCVLAWFAWAMLVVTTPPFADLPFQFVGTDVIGPGWYAASIALLLAAATTVKALTDSRAPVGKDLWVLAAIPGFGLLRLGRWSLGLTFAAVTCGAAYFASTDSPDASLFAEYGRSNNVPPAIPRGPEWILLGIASAAWLASIAVTVREKRRQGIS